jgi:hypothetical protein
MYYKHNIHSLPVTQYNVVEMLELIKYSVMKRRIEDSVMYVSVVMQE